MGQTAVDCQTGFRYSTSPPSDEAVVTDRPFDFLWDPRSIDHIYRVPDSDLCPGVTYVLLDGEECSPASRGDRCGILPMVVLGRDSDLDTRNVFAMSLADIGFRGVQYSAFTVWGVGVPSFGQNLHWGRIGAQYSFLMDCRSYAGDGLVTMELDLLNFATSWTSRIQELIAGQNLMNTVIPPNDSRAYISPDD
ncbi:hypothetical protein JW710_00470 [Candidatus Dojkabacteria bacterium]|nr:hypothetical protein [Candidatus Dojkabacteria bacterium]